MSGFTTDFNFDEWARLAKEEPEAFESMRQKMIEDVIENVAPSVKPRMEGLQWQIDQVRSKSANPMSSCLKISQMMWENVTGEDGLLENMRQLSEPQLISKLNKPKESAQIININDKNSDPKKS